jgi:ribA/ribD-fused uncharacterized protein
MIDQFKGQYRFLSNFYASNVWFGGLRYPTVEHAFQAAKTSNPEQRDWVRSSMTPMAARRRGRQVDLIPGWEGVKADIMTTLVLQKFSTHPNLRIRLLGTDDQKLVEGNNWGDQYWGVSNGEGKNVLGEILMMVREGLRLGLL